MDLYPKFIIEDGCLILQKVSYHKDIATDITKVKGGGWFRFEHDNKRFVFHSQSEDFGKATIEDIKLAIDNKEVYTNKYKTINIAEKYKFAYDTGSEIIELN